MRVLRRVNNKSISEISTTIEIACPKPKLGRLNFRHFILTKQDDYFQSLLTTFEASVFLGSWGSSGNGLKPKTKPLKLSLAFPNNVKLQIQGS